ncbi:MAG TPA: ATP-dependent zinc metalloprotease FtsH [Candidatus Hydrogenedentes bacterium]|nr:ATP-dependent zinc metalloprotease FtsH [Candidatus Hydrogenedentota bacterium]
MNNFLKHVSLWIVLLIIVVLVMSNISRFQEGNRALTEPDFVAQLNADNIKSVNIKEVGSNLLQVSAKFHNKVENQDSMEFKTDAFREEWRQQLIAQNVPYQYDVASTVWQGLLINILPLILIFGVFWFFMFRQMQGGSNKAMSFGKSRARMVNHGDKKVTFKDVAGVEEAKEELEEIIEFLKDPKRFSRLGGKIPRGVLLVGSPGSGKTLLARAVAGEAEVPFFSISGSDFVEMFVGVGASRVRDLFQQGHKNAPCIIFIDEIDAVGRQRGAGLGGGHDEREQTLNQLLVEMDGFNTNDGVILMAATNRPDVLDQALLRPGRFDRQIVVPNPDINGRKAIFEIHIKNQKIPLADDVDLGVLARGTPGFSGADLANLVNEAALIAARNGDDSVSMKTFEDAKDRVMMGPARRSMILSAKEKLATAHHEAGHTLVAKLLPDSDPVHKVTIIPRGMALGVTSWLPEEDRHSMTRSYCLAMIRVLMGGRAAEDIIYGEFTSGAANDLKRATHLAHKMVCEWGMSELGPITFGSADEVFLGRDFAKMRDFSEETASAVDREIHRICEDSYKDAKDMLKKRETALRALAEALYERETLESDEIDAIIVEALGPGVLPERPKPALPEMKEEKKEQVVERKPKERASKTKDMPPEGAVPETA